MNYSVYGLSRSGNHAIIEWLLKNLSNDISNVNRESKIGIGYGDSYHINDISSHDKHLNISKIISECKIKYNNLIVSYENLNYDYELDITKDFQKIIIIRDLPNVLASRYKFLTKNSGNQWMTINDEILDCWKKMAYADRDGHLLIKFDHWVSSKQYRDTICQRLEIENRDITNTVPSYGNGSSFVGMKLSTPYELKNRISKVEPPDYIKKMILDDGVTEIRKKLGFI